MSNKSKKSERPLCVNYCTSNKHRSSGDRKQYDWYEYSNLPPKSVNESVRICVISDTHDAHYKLGKLPACDIIIHAGDILMKSRKLTIEQAVNKLMNFNDWLGSQEATYKIVIGGNHDQLLQNLDASTVFNVFTKCTYLCNSSISLPEFRNLAVVGLPMSLGDSTNEAFQTKDFIAKSQHYIQSLPPNSVDILVTHGPCRNIGKEISPKIAHIFGHKHEEYGVYMRRREPYFTSDYLRDMERRRRSGRENSAPSSSNQKSTHHNAHEQRKEQSEREQRGRPLHTSSNSNSSGSDRFNSNVRMTRSRSRDHNQYWSGAHRESFDGRVHSELSIRGNSRNNVDSASHKTANRSESNKPEEKHQFYYAIAAPIMDDHYEPIQLPIVFDYFY